MTPTTRNAAIAAAATLLPAIAAAALYPDRARRMGHDLSSRIHDAMGDTSGTVEAETNRILARLDRLTHDLQDRVQGNDSGPSTAAMIGAGLVAAIAIPAALAAWFAPERLRQARDYVLGDDDRDRAERDLQNLTARLDDLSENIERQRESAFDSVTAAAAKSDD